MAIHCEMSDCGYRYELLKVPPPRAWVKHSKLGEGEGADTSCDIVARQVYFG